MQYFKYITIDNLENILFILTKTGESNTVDPDVTIFLCGSSCNYLVFFSFIPAPLRSLSLYWHPQGQDGMIRNKKRYTGRENDTEKER